MKMQTIKIIVLVITAALAIAIILGLRGTWGDGEINIANLSLKPEANVAMAVAGNGGKECDLLYFNATQDGREITLMWDAANELELVGYQIERAEGDGEFERVGWIYSRELSREMFYDYVDNDIDPSQSYSYRLKMVDFDGRVTYSETIKAVRALQ